MVATPSVEVSQSFVSSISGGPTEAVQISQAFTIAVWNFPTESLELSQAFVTAISEGPAASLDVSQAIVTVIFRGRDANPRVQSWTYTLDGHDFYVLRIGDSSTLVYDTATEQWVEWTSPDLPFWRLRSGISWVGGQSLANNFGSNIVAGDDVRGLLWVLDPDQPYDEAAVVESDPFYFERVVTGQVAMRARQVMPCYAIFLNGDNYALGDLDFTASVTLEYSDDAGKTYESAGTITVTAETVEQTYDWLSLGQIENPGRLFRITDNGVFTRIDGMIMNDESSDDDG